MYKTNSYSNFNIQYKDMNKRKLGAVLIAIVAIAASWNFNQRKNTSIELSELAFANSEALATCERTVGGSCWWTNQSYTKCCEGGWYGCSPCD